jgi:hypothetical protein
VVNGIVVNRGCAMVGNIHGPNQRDHLEQFINAKEKDYKEILQESFSQSIIDK